MTGKVLVTGASGFISKHVLKSLLNQNYSVVGTVRSAQKADDVKALMEKLGVDTAKLSFEILDLNKDDGWDDVAKGCDYVQHLASPFPSTPSKDREALVPTAKGGALRVLKAAIKAEAKRFIVTASVASMMYNENRAPATPFSEQDWSNPEWELVTSYIISKTRAEKAIWDHAEAEGYSQHVTSIHPGLVFGPALDHTIGTSLELIKKLLKGNYPIVPDITLPIVDVRDVADLHLLAMTTQNVGNRRLIAVDASLSMMKIGQVLKNKYPNKWLLPSLILPDILIKPTTLYDSGLKVLLPDIGRPNKADTQYVKDLTGIKFRSSRKAIEDAAQSLYNHNIL